MEGESSVSEKRQTGSQVFHWGGGGGVSHLRG